MRKLFFTLLLFTYIGQVKGQDAAQLLYNKAMEYFSFEKTLYDSGNLSMFLASRYFDLAADLGSESAKSQFENLYVRGYILTNKSYTPELRQAAIEGDWEAMLDLAECLFLDFDVPDSYESIYGSINRDINKLFVTALGKMADDPEVLQIEYNAAFMLWYIFRLYKENDLDNDFISDVRDFSKDEFEPAMIEYALLLLNEKYEKHNYKKGVKMLEDILNPYSYLLLSSIYKTGYYNIKPDLNKSNMYLTTSQILIKAFEK